MSVSPLCFLQDSPFSSFSLITTKWFLSLLFMRYKCTCLPCVFNASESQHYRHHLSYHSYSQGKLSLYVTLQTLLKPS